MQKSFGFKHVIFIAVVVFLSLWTWMFRYEVMRLEGNVRFLLDRFTGKAYVGGGTSPWHEIKIYSPSADSSTNRRATP